MLERIKDIVMTRYRVHEGDEYGVPRDCPIKRAYKLQMQETMFKRLVSDFTAFCGTLGGLSEDQVKEKVAARIKSYESEDVYQ